VSQAAIAGFNETLRDDFMFNQELILAQFNSLRHRNLAATRACNDLDRLSVSA
jgi:hypothetical protein